MSNSFHITAAASIIAAYNPALAAIFTTQPANRWAVAKAIRTVAGEAVYASIAARIEMNHILCHGE